jgi:hypothetical protein
MRSRLEARNPRPLGFYPPSAFDSSLVNNNLYAPIFNDDTTDSYVSVGDLSPINTRPIDNTLLDISKDFELNINEIVTNVLY